jgi:hypothetical protein
MEKWNNKTPIPTFIKEQNLIGIHIDWRSNTPVGFIMEKGDPCKRMDFEVANDVVRSLEIGEENWTTPHLERLAIYYYDNNGVKLVSKENESI